MPRSASPSPAPVTASPRTTPSSPATATRAGSRAKPRTRWPAAISRGARSAPIAPVTPVTRTLMRGEPGEGIGVAQNVRKMRLVLSRRRAKGPVCWEERGLARNLRHLREASLRALAVVWLDARRSASEGVGEEVGAGDGEGSRCREEGVVRGVLLPVQPPLCARPRRAVRDLPPGPSRRPPAAAAAALHLPPGTPDAGGVGVPHGAGAGRAPSLTSRRLTK